jgi:2-polyprenyl-3-methyl-5-hydroxy-6-metoxy-1,4-benzoquinol methylase
MSSGNSVFGSVPLTAVQKYWNDRPCNIRHSTREVGTEEYFNEVEWRKYKVEPHIPEFADFERWRGKKVLEIGCGIGTDTMNFARCGAQVTSIDLSDHSLAIARQRAEVFHLQNRIRFVQADAERLSDFVPVEPYDLIYSFGVIHHTPHPERVMEQIRKYLKPGATVKIMVYNRWCWKVFWILFGYGKGKFWRLNRLIAENSEAQTGCPVTYVYSRRQGRRLLESCGLKVTHTRVDHVFPYRIRDYVKYSYVKVWYFRWMPDAVFRALERIAGWHLCLTAKADPAERTPCP